MRPLLAITPVRDEAAFLPALMECMDRQLLRPALWTIVDDGSSDGTTAIAAEFVSTRSWTRLLHTRRDGPRLRGPAVVAAIMLAIRNAAELDFGFVAKIDAEITMPDDLLLRLVERMNADSTIGISGPELLIQRHEGWAVERELPEAFVRGPARIYRRECLEDIGGLVARKGWDGIDVIKSQALGWRTVRHGDLQASMHRAIGASSNRLPAAVQDGRGSCFMGALPSYAALEALEFRKRQPYVLGAIAFLYGYLLGWVSRDVIDDRTVTDYVRAQHRAIVRSRLRNIVRKVLCIRPVRKI